MPFNLAQIRDKLERGRFAVFFERKARSTSGHLASFGQRLATFADLGDLVNRILPHNSDVRNRCAFLKAIASYALGCRFKNSIRNFTNRLIERGGTAVEQLCGYWWEQVEAASADLCVTRSMLLERSMEPFHWINDLRSWLNRVLLDCVLNTTVFRNMKGFHWHNCDEIARPLLATILRPSIWSLRRSVPASNALCVFTKLNGVLRWF